MSTLSVRLPDSLHQAAKRVAKQDNTSLDQLITLALAEKISALDTEDYLVNRAKQGNRKAFDKLLAKVPNNTPDESDRI